jgi:hypothetical protein
MKKKSNKFVLGAVIVLFLVIPLTIFFLQLHQELLSRAQKASTLYFTTANSTVAGNIMATPGQTINMDMYVNPGTNAISTIKYVITYDPQVLTPNPTQFTFNTAALPVNMEGPAFSSGQIQGTLGIGNNPTGAITTTTKVATLNFTVTSDLTKLKTPTTVKLQTGTNQTQILAIDATSLAAENVLSTVNDGVITFALPTPTMAPTNTPFPTPTNTPIPTPTKSPTPTPTNTPIPTNTPTPQTSLDLTFYLHGVGNSGDNVNAASSLSNKSPQTPTRAITLALLNPSTSQTVLQTTGNVSYKQTDGTFQGTVTVTNLPSGTYKLKVSTDKYLQKFTTTTITIGAGVSHLTIPPLTLTDGDVNTDNRLSVLDYNQLMDCYSDALPAKECHDSRQNFMSDLNDDSKVNQFDYNLFLRELSVQYGD